jgi:glutathione synthase
MDPATQERVRQAADYAVAGGLLKYTPQGRLEHAPFALNPCPIHPAALLAITELTPLFNRLALAVSRAPDFLREALAPAAAVDGFTRLLLERLAAAEGNQPLQALVSRSDYFLVQPPAGGPPQARQVELNTIAASYPALAGCAYRLHRRLWADRPWAQALVPNDPAPVLADVLADAFARYGDPQACLLMVVQPGEANVFDQRLLELALRERGVFTRRMTLPELAAAATLKGGHLRVDGQTAAVTYLRAGYTPDDLASPEARRALEVMDRSSTVAVPNVALHLAGAKRVQQVLTQPALLRRFADEAAAARLEATFVGQYALDDEIAGPAGALPAWRAAQAAPERWVLKPQREGGGNNLYGADLAARLARATAEERRAYVLMERIVPLTHRATLVREREASEALCVSEIGRFGALLADGAAILRNEDAGYLARTRPEHLREGGVSAGFGVLDSLVVTPEGGAPV